MPPRFLDSPPEDLFIPDYREPDRGPFYPGTGMEFRGEPAIDPGLRFAAGGAFGDILAQSFAQLPQPGTQGPPGDVFGAHLLTSAARTFGQSRMTDMQRREEAQAALDAEARERNRRTAALTEQAVRDRVARRREGRARAATLERENRAEERALARETRQEERAFAREERAAGRRSPHEDQRAYRVSKEMSQRLGDPNFPVGKAVTFSEYETLRKRAYPEPEKSAKPATARETMQEVTATEDLRATVLRRIRAARDPAELQDAVNLIPPGNALERDREVRENYLKRTQRMKGKKR